MQSKRILIVDDMRTLQMVLPVYLVGKFYEFETASSGTEALEKAETFGPDLVISDIQMPDFDGIQLCRVLRRNQRFSKVPIILMSSTLNDVAVRQRAEAAGASALLTKPIDPTALAEAVQRLMGVQAGDP